MMPGVPTDPQFAATTVATAVNVWGAPAPLPFWRKPATKTRSQTTADGHPFPNRSWKAHVRIFVKAKAIPSHISPALMVR